MRKLNLVQLLLLTSILLTSCSSIRELSPSYTKTYRITYNYSCQQGYIMAQDVNGNRFCVLSDNSRFKTFSHETKVNTKTTIKKPKKVAKINCQRVFKEINQCMR